MAGKKSRAGYDGKIAGLYDLEDTIGRGHFAVVKLARHVFTGEKVAVKVIDKTKLDEVSRAHLFQEVRCMKLVQHPNVVRLYEVIDTQTKLYLILELGDGGDMYDYIMKHTGGLQETVAKRYFRQIVEAISYCHKLHVVHRDLKPENVVFFEKLGLVKLTDFGFSNMFAPGKKLETSCGSLAYSAPEILLGDSYDAPAVDVWSLGVILFMLVVGAPPFQEANDSETLTMIMDCKYHVPSQISDACRELISRMLQREPTKRATLGEIMEHPWLNDGDLTPMSSSMPLITKEMISEEDQTYIVQKMVDGKIATREEIITLDTWKKGRQNTEKTKVLIDIQSLEKNSYDHITATYYLLIERRLRKHQQYEQQIQSATSVSLRKQIEPSSSRPVKPHLEPLMLSPRKQRELKKTKTVPLAWVQPTQVSPPSIMVSPPAEGEVTVSPGPYFMKSLTISMTLDRRKEGKKTRTPSLSGSVAPRACLRKKHTARNRPVEGAAAKTDPTKVESAAHITAITKKQQLPKISKIALLSSFFERKAKQQASGEKDAPGMPKFNLTWLGNRRGKSNFVRQRLMDNLETPGSPSPTEKTFGSPVLGIQGAEVMDSGTSQYVQSLVSPPGTHPSTSTTTSRHLQTPMTDSNLLVPPPVVPRKCSLIQEESFDEFDDDDDDDCNMDAAIIKPVKSLESLEDFSSSSASYALLSPNSAPNPPASAEPVNPRRPLKTVSSSPQLLNQIHEENESEDEDDFVPLKLSTPRRFGSHHNRENSSASPEILRKYEQRKKHRGAGQRGTSCSSSDASDTDDTEGRSRKEKLRHKFVHRRDSSDHSSDTDGPGGNIGGGDRLGSNGSNSSHHHRRGSSESGGGGSSGSSGGGGGGGGGGTNDSGSKKENSDSKSNNKNSTNNHRNSKHHGGGSKGSLTDTSIKMLTRKLNDISNGVGALLNDCRGSDCENSSPLHKATANGDSESMHRQSCRSSIKSNTSNKSGNHSDTSLERNNDRNSQVFTVGPKSSPVQYLGHMMDCDSICGRRQSLEFSEISGFRADGESVCSVTDFPGKGNRKLSGPTQGRNSEVCSNAVPPGCCKPGPNSVTVVAVKSKCCSVV